MNRQSILNAALSSIENQYKTSILQTSQEPPRVIHTGSFALDRALCVGGYPYGFITEISGEASSGKSTLVLQAIAFAQKNKKVCALIDTERTFNGSYAASLGVNLQDLIVLQPECGEHAFDMATKLIQNGVSLVAFDSISALVPQSEVNGEMTDDDNYSGLAKLMSKGLQRFIKVVNEYHALAIFTNQRLYQFR